MLKIILPTATAILLYLGRSEVKPAPSPTIEWEVVNGDSLIVKRDTIVFKTYQIPTKKQLRNY